ncbi:snRNA-activating protein complex subunit 5-like [Glandiceps talaboti]
MSSNLLTELQELRQEEKVMSELEDRMKEQLNRLKVEELALRSMIAMKSAETSQGHGQNPSLSGDVASNEPTVSTNDIPLDLESRFLNTATEVEIEEEEEEEDMDDDEGEEEEEEEEDSTHEYSSQLMELMQQMHQDNSQYES